MLCYAECCRLFGHRLNCDKFERKPLLQWSNSKRGEQKRQISGGQQTDPKIQRRKMKHEKWEKEGKEPKRQMAVRSCSLERLLKCQDNAVVLVDILGYVCK